jgi:hypothetical protein
MTSTGHVAKAHRIHAHTLVCPRSLPTVFGTHITQRVAKREQKHDQRSWRDI